MEDLSRSKTHENCPPTTERSKPISRSEFEKVKLENIVLREKLSVAESQIEDLKSQLAYYENGDAP